MIRILTIAATILLLAACGGTSGGAEPRATPPPPVAAPAVVASRVVCNLSADTPGARAAQVVGLDGAQSAVAGGVSYWFFGDTLREGPNGRRDVVPAAVATTRDTDASDCLDLTFKTNAAGSVEPLFPRLDETTAWPDGVLPLDDGSITFYMVKAYRQSPFAWNVGAVGLGRVPAGAGVKGERMVETIWDETSGFGRISGVRSPVRDGDGVIVYLRTDAGDNYIARAPLDGISSLDAYRYWDGDAWQDDPARAEPMWRTEQTGFPADNGVQVTYDKTSGLWLALYNADLATVAVRTGAAPMGPWSEPITWLDCRAFAGEAYPYCYSAELHPELDRDGGRTRYITVSTQEPYDVALIELKFAAPE